MATFGLLNSDLTMFGLSLLRFAQILTQICLNMVNLAQILLKLSQIPVGSTLTRSKLIRFQPNLGQISIDTMEYRPNLVRSSQISAKIWRNHKTRNRPIITRNPIRPNPVDLKLSTGWLRVEIFPTREGRVESRLGTNLTRPDPTRGHP